MNASELGGVVIKGYECRERIGVGAFGAVYRAFQTSIRREVAIKVIRPEYANQPDFIRQFEVEAQVVARLEHPHIVPLYDYWRDPQGAYLAMRWLRGSLSSSIESRAWQLTEIAHLLDQIASALALAHREGIVHRDIRPNNILLDEDENAYVADFGIARNIHLRQMLSEDAHVFENSAEYISPEQIRGELVSNRTDIYSLGYVIYELVTGEKAFPDATTPSDYLQKHLTTSLPTVTSRKATVPAAVDEVLRTATAKAPSHRYPTALRFAAAFRAAIPAILSSTSWQPLAEPLTGRELEVLNLMINDLSINAIAERLVLTPGTVRWYTKQIYRKLDVNNRQQAVERALSLKLNEPRTAVSRVQVLASEEPAATDLSLLGVEPDNPYKGLRAFQETDAEDFFGRAALTEHLLSRLSEFGDASRFLVIVGPSGSGKSSVVRAGLIPALRRGALASSPKPFIADFLPGAYPIEELEAALLRVSTNPLPGLFTQLSEDRRGLVRGAKQLLPPDPKTELILFIDQFEELFMLVEDETIRVHFLDLLLSAVADPRSRIRVVVTLRADFFDRPLMYPRLAELVRSNSEVIVPLTVRELEQAIIAPVERLGMRLETGLATTIIDDVGEQPGTLPLLEYALTELFEHREGMILTLDGYKATGGVSRALAKRADQLYDGFEKNTQAMARQLFLRLITLGEGTEDTRRRTLIAELVELDSDGQIEEVINTYVEYRLLTLDHDPVTRGPTIEIAHEALIREWTRLREWLLDSREDIRVQHRLGYMADQWRGSGMDTSFLAHGAQLKQLETWANGTDLILSAREREFLTTSIGQRQREDKAEAERRTHELRLERRSRNIARVLTVVMAISLIAALGLAAIARNQADIAAANFQHSEAARIASAAGALLPGNENDYPTAALLAIRSLQLQYSPQADAALSQATRVLHTVRHFPGVPGYVSRARFSPDQQMLALETSEFDIQIWNANDWTLLQTLYGHTGPLPYLEWSPNSELLVTSSWDGSTRIWDVQAGAELKQFPGTYWRAHFSPDNRWIAMTLLLEWEPLVWDLVADAEIPLLPQFEDLDFVWDIVFSADGQSIMFFDGNNRGRVLNLELQQPLQAFNCASFWDLILSLDGRLLMCPDWITHRVNFWDTMTWEISRSVESEAIYPLAFSPEGTLAAVGLETGQIQIIDIVSGQILREWIAAEATVSFAEFLPDGQRLVTGSADGTARLWDIRTGLELRRYSGFDDAWVQGVSADGRLALINSYYGAHLVDIDIGNEPRAFMGSAISGVMYSPDGSQILIGDAGVAYLWDVVPERVIRGFSMEGSEAEGIYWPRFSPDGQKILTGGVAAGIRLWDAETGALERTLPGPIADWYVAYAPDGSHVAGSNDLGDIYIWDLASDQITHIPAGNNGAIGIVYSPDSTILASTDISGLIHLWNPNSGQLEQTIDVGALVHYFEFSPDSRYLAFVGRPSVSQIWDIERNELLSGFPELQNGSTILFSTDGDEVFVGFGDGSIRVMNVQSGAELRSFKPHSSRVIDISRSPDGRYIASAAADGSVYISDVEISSLIDYACSRLLWDLRPEQRIQYGIIDDEPICSTEGVLP